MPEVVPDARHEAILSLHRALLAVENGDVHSAARHTHSALAWLREIPFRPEAQVAAVKA